MHWCRDSEQSSLHCRSTCGTPSSIYTKVTFSGVQWRSILREPRTALAHSWLQTVCMCDSCKHTDLHTTHSWHQHQHTTTYKHTDAFTVHRRLRSLWKNQWPHPVPFRDNGIFLPFPSCPKLFLTVGIALSSKGSPVRRCSDGKIKEFPSLSMFQRHRTEAGDVCSFNIIMISIRGRRTEQEKGG